MYALVLQNMIMDISFIIQQETPVPIDRQCWYGCVTPFNGAFKEKGGFHFGKLLSFK
jgi:hypothetical protein